MGFHTFDAAHAETLNDPERFRYCSVEELLWMLEPAPTATVVDLGSGTGFFTRPIAPHVDRVIAIDVQQQMHRQHKAAGYEPNVQFVTGHAQSLPLASGSVDAIYSIMTYHEYAGSEALAELHRVLTAGGRHVIVDWSATDPEATAPPASERYRPDEAVEHHRSAGFSIEQRIDRHQTFAMVATV